MPDNGGFAIAAGLEQAIEYVQQLHFDEDDIAYLRSRNMFDEGFLQYLRGFRFTGDIWAVPEGTPIFPREPIMTVRAPPFRRSSSRRFLLLTLNHQSLIATKARRVVRAAKAARFWKFGSRRAQGVDAAVDGARAPSAAAEGTACTLTDQLYGVPAGGTMAHSLGADVPVGIRGVSRPTAKRIRRTPRCWSIRIIRSNPASRMPSASSTRF